MSSWKQLCFSNASANALRIRRITRDAFVKLNLHTKLEFGKRGPSLHLFKARFRLPPWPCARRCWWWCCCDCRDQSSQPKDTGRDTASVLQESFFSFWMFASFEPFEPFESLEPRLFLLTFDFECLSRTADSSLTLYSLRRSN